MLYLSMPHARLRYYRALMTACICMSLSQACKKDSVKIESKLDLLTTKSWQLTNLYHQEQGDNTISDFTTIYYKDCEKDDSYHFMANNVFFRRDSTDQCGNLPRYGIYGGGDWSVDSSFSKITFNSFPNFVYKMEIATLTPTTLELTHRVLDYFQKEIIFTFRFKAIPK